MKTTTLKLLLIPLFLLVKTSSPAEENEVEMKISAAKEKDTPLLDAITKDKPLPDIQLLIDNRADVNEEKEGNTPIIEASRKNRADVVNLLITSNANPLQSCDRGVPYCKIPFCGAFSVAPSPKMRTILINQRKT